MSVSMLDVAIATSSRDSDLNDILRREPTAADLLDVEHFESHEFVLSFVRHIMRDRTCTKIPVVLGFVGFKTNRFGHNVQIEVEYDKNRPWRAIYAARFDGNLKLRDIQCYMD